jgi:hypothetical protein
MLTIILGKHEGDCRAHLPPSPRPRPELGRAAPEDQPELQKLRHNHSPYNNLPLLTL